MANVTAASPAMRRRWQLRGRVPEGDLASAPYPPLVRHLLWHRGVRTADQARAFVDAAPVDYDPLLLPDARPALERLRRAVQEGELVAVYGDFDVDGVTASAILIEALRGLGAAVTHHIPDRFAEGYGVNIPAIDELASVGTALIVTADCGTSSAAEIEHAAGLGVDVIVVDHHTVPPQLPQAVAIVNPKREGNEYPDPELATGGLAFKLMTALYELLGRAWQPERYLDLVALSTVCDVVPLRDENRSLVQRGLAALARTQRAGLRALCEASGIDPQRLDADSIGYALGPRLNAAGRLAHAGLALELLLETDASRAGERARELTALNQQRQQATAAAVALAQELLSAEEAGLPLIFVGHRDIPSGIVGLVAARLAEERYRPAVVYELGDETSRASCRSIPEFDITGALRRCPELMLRFGGHRAAAGFTARNEMLPPLREALLSHAGACLSGLDLAPLIDIDAAIPLHRVTGRLIQSLMRLAPFGQDNPEPTFLSRDLEVADARAVGSEGTHLRLRLRDGRVTWPAIAFGHGALDVRPGQRLDVVYSFSPDRGTDGGLELRVKDVAPSTAPAPAAAGMAGIAGGESAH
ncbi:MAG: single-stranded-DNA-specific exonuclease RecJ [Dehalococcoidia bacterium]|nr:single-stranded-DNA-specific exonuclease RecJ [Dehalococcoidia bacterium]